MNQSSLHHAIISEASLRLKDECLSRILQCIDLLNDDQLWYSPNEVTNSVGNLILHLCGNIRQYLCHGIGGEADIRVRESEFKSQYTISSETLKKLITAAILDGLNHLDAVPSDNWLKEVKVQVFTLTQYSALIHVIEHTSYHVGQITYLTKSQTSRETDYYADFDL